MVELTEVESGHLLYLVQAVNKSITVNKELSRGLGDIEVILKERLNGDQGLAVECLYRSALESLLEIHLAQRCRQLIDKSADAEILVAENGLFDVEHLSDLESDLRLLVRACKLLNMLDDRTDTDIDLDIEFGEAGIGDTLRNSLDLVVGRSEPARLPR